MFRIICLDKTFLRIEYIYILTIPLVDKELSIVFFAGPRKHLA